ncbi:coiled-coil domain-containing protein [Micromonospora sp. NPDC050397]|uniref:coiled-coil domain-containing protein n=1 Tax=Micromonospora sp. NPDC050397 TaxID=3364279 RepID=UPI00384F98BA
MTAPLRRWFTPALALFASAVMVAPFSVPAQAAPTPAAPTESDTPLLSEVLDQTGRRFLDAKAALEASKKRQGILAAELKKAEEQIEALTPQVAEIAARAYRTGKLGPVSALLNSASPDSFLDRAAALEEMNAVNDHKMHELNAARELADRAKALADAEVKEQEKQQTVIARQKSDAEKALALVGGKRLTNGFVNASSPVAKAAPRTASGGWPAESCSKDDPTTSGCITPRTLHAYNEVKKAGFNLFVGCHRNGGPFEHPKGRACDWSLLKSGFAPAATNAQRLYGNNLTAFLVRNADRLGILYVIWYKQIWFPATGWQSYSGESDHTDHVHMSML